MKIITGSVIESNIGPLLFIPTWDCTSDLKGEVTVMAGIILLYFILIETVSNFSKVHNWKVTALRR